MASCTRLRPRVGNWGSPPGPCWWRHCWQLPLFGSVFVCFVRPTRATRSFFIAYSETKTTHVRPHVSYRAYPNRCMPHCDLPCQPCRTESVPMAKTVGDKCPNLSIRQPRRKRGPAARAGWLAETRVDSARTRPAGCCMLMSNNCRPSWYNT